MAEPGPSQGYVCDICGTPVKEAKFRFCRRCEINNSPIHPCPSCKAPCRGRQCRDCHKAMYSHNFCVNQNCYGWKASGQQLCARCLRSQFSQQSQQHNPFQEFQQQANQQEQPNMPQPPSNMPQPPQQQHPEAYNVPTILSKPPEPAPAPPEDMPVIGDDDDAKNVEG